MPGGNTGELVKLAMTPAEVESNGSVTVKRSPKFEVMLNPSTYSHQYTIRYDQTKTFGQVGTASKFSAVSPEKISFDIMLDGTGVISPGQSASDVRTRIQQLYTVVYKYDGTNHQPNHVRILWGSLIFFGRLESMSIEYTLFEPSGQPLRAKVKLAFVGFMTKEEQVLKANRSSPDLSHRVEVKAGDTLPLLCHRIYSDASYYLEVAKINNLTNFRDIQPGVWLDFPPLR
ncbi:MAG: peptidoglycan-binding protein [Nitrospira sp.]